MSYGFKVGTLARMMCAGCNEETLHKGFQCTRTGCQKIHPLAFVIDKPEWNGRARKGAMTTSAKNYKPQKERPS